MTKLQSKYGYEWKGPHEWLFDHVHRTIDYHRRYPGQALPELVSIIRALADRLDGDAIQALFQCEMKHDGYFREGSSDA
jgi:hypothetical protein